MVQKFELQQKINEENGIEYHKNINLNGYTVYRGESFISFRLVDIKNKKVVIIDYIYITSKTNLIQLLSWCVNFWSGNAVKYVYYKEHKRMSNIVSKCFPQLGFTIKESTYNNWKHPWVSTNGFDETDIIEAYTE